MPDKNSSQKKSSDKDEHIKDAHDEAEKDIEKDPDLKIENNKTNDLDEGELARLEGHP